MARKRFVKSRHRRGIERISGPLCLGAIAPGLVRDEPRGPMLTGPPPSPSPRSCPGTAASIAARRH